MNQHAPADQREQQDAEQGTHQPNVDTHVAVQYVAELVCDHTLQFGAIELLQGSPGDRHRGVRGRVAGGECVDAGFLLKHVNLGHRHTRSQRDFLDHVAQTAPVDIPRVGLDQRAAKLPRDLATARPQAGRLEQAGQADNGDTGNRAAAQQGPARLYGLDHAAGGYIRIIVARADCEQQDQVDGHDDGDHGQNEDQDEPAGLPSRPVLVLEKVHPVSETDLGRLALGLILDFE